MAIFGDSGLKKQPGAKYVCNTNGLATYDLRYKVTADFGSISLMQGDAPLDGNHSNLVLLNFTVTESGDSCEDLFIDLHYEGKDSTHTQRFVSEECIVDVQTSHEPIESHPDFVTDIGGKLGSAKHGAIFEVSGNTAGKFLFFPIIDPDEPDVLPSRFTGVSSYLMPQLTITQNDIDEEWPDNDEIALVGKIVDLPFVDPPTLPEPRNWLYTGLRIRNIANVAFESQRIYMESGPRGWIPEIYTPTGI